MNWTVHECIDKFKTLCDEAFTRRKGSRLPVVSSLVENYHHSKYQTSSLERAFTSAFTNELYLFGGQRPDQPSGSPVKVAVTAASLDGTEAYVISNYNRRQQGHKPAYHFQRPESDSAELKIWEAARATTAAPTYFKSFHHKESQKIYIDGAILHNNPVRIADSERRMIWPSHQVPDLVLSIGTGPSPVPERRESRHRRAARNGILSHGLHLYGIMRNNFEQKLNCEKTWDEYYAGIAGSLPESVSTSRFHRINPNVGEIPALDEKEKMETLRAKAEQVLRSDLDSQINQIARQLIASSFYFELHSASNPKLDGTTNIYGKIHCRLIDGSLEVHEFGKHILTRAKRNENLQFMVFQDGDTNPLAILPLTSKTTDSMIQKWMFYIDPLRFSVKNRLLPTQIHLCFGHVQMHPISGFPRLIIPDDERSNPNSAILNYTPKTSSQRYTHGSRRLKRYNSKWKAPDLRGASSLSNLHEYATKRDCKLGHDFMESGVAESTRKQPQPPAQARTELSAGLSKKPSVKLGIRETFSTLMWPLRTLEEEEAEEPGSIDTGPLPPDLEEWFREYRKIQNKLTVPGPASGIPPEELVAALRNYNIKPEEYAVYEQWVNLLQPDKWRSKGKGYWLPPIDSGPDNIARSETPGKVHELDSIVVAELMDTSLPRKQDSLHVEV
ncbi:acyl transferase/acyl hydrolase/lysophospholipase [Hypoxylon rubiginosum]|uniref:Acyl transferase/acyl hydrolase/lysophospholipase n=1 Tax=Hypoxylon rubiginosum TaxID=110542 RepID=A0ACB9YH47_9PEZI|nr:acyl transferase/acyl hydrolase/lysophospholipase [Hypoxylon rubiginosum]